MTLPERRHLSGSATAALVIILLFSSEELLGRFFDRRSEIEALLLEIPIAGAAAGMLAFPFQRLLPRSLALVPPLFLGFLLSLQPIANRVPFGRSPLLPAVLLASASSAAASALLRRGPGYFLPAAAVLSYLTLWILFFLPGIGTTPAHGRPNVVLITMDTTRRDYLSVYGYPLATTPALERLASESSVYDDAWSVAPWTPPSHASIMTGLLPGLHGVDGHDPSPFPPGLVTLQDVFHEAGYRTAGVVANPNLTAPGWNRGYDEYRAAWYLGRHSLVRLLNGWWLGSINPWLLDRRRASARVVSVAESWWARQGDHPRYLFLNFMDPHRPYDPPEYLRNRFLPDVSRAEQDSIDQDPNVYTFGRTLDERQVRILRGLYAGEIAAMDFEIGRFTTWLRERGDLDNTILVLTADHGERLGERGLVGHQAPAERSMDQFLLRVPLLIRYPGKVPVARIPHRVQLDGLAAQILMLAGYDVPVTFASRPWNFEDPPLALAAFENPVWLLDELHAMDPGRDLSRFAGDWVFASDGTLACTCPLRSDPGRCVATDLLQDPEWKHTSPDANNTPLCAAALKLPAFSAREATSTNDELRERLRSLGYVR